MTYNPADFKPGDVAMVTTWGGTRRAYLSSSNWLWAGGAAATHGVLDARPLVVLDPESDEDVARLREEYDRAIATGAGEGLKAAFLANQRERTEALGAALRSLTRPPKPDEPKGRAAVVQDRAGDAWAREGDVPRPWRKVGVLSVWRDWAELDVAPDGVKFGGVS